jgi:hypothetical protein
MTMMRKNNKNNKVEGQRRQGRTNDNYNTDGGTTTTMKGQQQ